jgi:uncharacterized protein (TIGR00251 family)
MLHLTETAEGILFWVLVQPRSSRNMIAGIQDDALKIKLTAPPVEGAANKMCVSFIAKCLGIPKSAVDIRTGLTSRKKRILIRFESGTDAGDLAAMKASIAALAAKKTP